VAGSCVPGPIMQPGHGRGAAEPRNGGACSSAF
jgi:hypothetical protein